MKAKENCHQELTALARIDNIPRSLLDYDPEVSLPATANLAALSIDWLGFIELVSDPTHRRLLQDVPPVEDGETAPEYITRIWPKLPNRDRGAALDLGLQKAATMEKIAQVGIQVRIWRAYQSGEWIHSPSGESKFSSWVRSVLVDTLEASHSEASKLASTCKAVEFLRSNDFPGVRLPDDLEECFRRPHYGRWKIISPKILQFQELLELMPDQEDEIVEGLVEIVDTVYEDMSQAERANAARLKAPRLPPIVLIETGRNPKTGLREGTFSLSESQHRFFHRKMGSALDYRLEGETYNVKDYRLVQYRYEEAINLWSRRTWWDDHWSPWKELPGDLEVVGHLDSVHDDEELGLEYLTYWEEE